MCFCSELNFIWFSVLLKCSCQISECIFLCVQKPGGKTDVVPLCGALIQWTTEKSSRKNVFQVKKDHYTGSFDFWICEFSVDIVYLGLLPEPLFFGHDTENQKKKNLILSNN